MKSSFLSRIIVIAAAATVILAAAPAYAADHAAGVFRISLPASFRPASAAKTAELRQGMIGGAQTLARSSGLGDPRDIGERGVSFFSAFQHDSSRLIVAFAGVPSPVALDAEEMYRTNAERVRWGIDTKRLKPSSAGVSKLSIDGVPALLMDIETASGQRMRTYLFFVPEKPKLALTMAILCEDSNACTSRATDIDAAVTSLKVIRAGK